MQIDDKLLTKLEKLSSLQIGDDKREEIKKQLSEIVSFVDILNELNLDNDKAMVNMTNGATLLREDVISSSSVIDDTLKYAPLREGNFFVVPKIIE
ncbi:Glutamyl-tRNA(Gln) amidotransferase subunit C [Campylobacter majalis]|uniref:Aspartyl/glutamyl-tRNA(Asn/Gln) amidotransferase subunit C n=1 Tax=Campylobacter majalis TaxID=2790656 RepID=A0ABM8Q8S2_9BACT|nr:Asp-tRNA(Asn)/Glu-tRNA(Gln) amidotransferase subunit GatC [Campylobacter majalis]CAD7289373.1 Glutamyl-tRNA(Gln) amidotransferase subunit C [Campylobacter majalis]